MAEERAIERRLTDLEHQQDVINNDMVTMKRFNATVYDRLEAVEVNCQPMTCKWHAFTFQIVCQFVVSPVHFTPYLMGLSSMSSRN